MAKIVLNIVGTEAFVQVSVAWLWWYIHIQMMAIYIYNFVACYCFY